MTAEEMGLLEAIHADPHSEVPRLIYADWLEDHGSPLAEYIRAECDLLAIAPDDRRFGKRLDRLERVVRTTGTVLGGWEHVPTLERLKAKMERLRARDSKYKLFGSSEHKYQLEPPLREAELLELEQRLGFLLPSEYRAFALRVCNGRMGPSYGLEPLVPSRAPADLAELCPLTDADAEAVLRVVRSSEPLEYPDLPYSPPGTLYLAEHGCGGYSFLVLSGPQRGKMWGAGDFTGPDVDRDDLAPRGFFAWYEAWLDHSLKGRLS